MTATHQWQNLSEGLQKVARSEEFASFSEYMDELMASARQADEAEFHRTITNQRLIRKQQIREASEVLRVQRRRTWIGIPLASLLGAGIVAAAVIVVLNRFFSYSWMPQSAWLTSWWTIAGAVVVALLAAFVWLVVVAILSDDYHIASEELERLRSDDPVGPEQLDAFAADSYRRAINRVLGPRGLVPFPRQAPDLVESTTGPPPVDTESIKYVRDLVGQHKTSAIGVAGPRGSGKTTLIGDIAGAPGSKEYRVQAASRYEPMDLLRRLAFVLAEEDYDEFLKWQRSHEARPRGFMLWLAFLALIVGVLLAFSDRFSEWLDSRGPAEIAGAVLVAAAVLIILWNAISNRRERRVKEREEWRTGNKPGSKRALNLVRSLRSEMMREQTGKATLSLGSVLGFEGTTASRATSRPLTYGELVDELRAILKERGVDPAGLQEHTLVGQEQLTSLQEIAAGSQDDVIGLQEDLSGPLEEVDSSLESSFELQEDVFSWREDFPEPYSRVVVVLDELDKLPDVDSLVNVVNSIKDLFHIPGVHFLVSVSDEALASFQLRGLESRDAFDSSFDAVVAVGRLSPDEASRVLESRVAGLPPGAVAFCAVWSGGLPRDLIRAARDCIAICRLSPTALTWQETARKFLKGDIAARMEAMGGSAAGTIDAAEIARVIDEGLDAARIEELQPATRPALALLLAACCIRAIDLADEHPATVITDPRLSQLSGGVASLSTNPDEAIRALRASYGSTTPANGARTTE